MAKFKYTDSDIFSFIPDEISTKDQFIVDYLLGKGVPKQSFLDDTYFSISDQKIFSKKYKSDQNFVVLGFFGCPGYEQRDHSNQQFGCGYVCLFNANANHEKLEDNLLILPYFSINPSKPYRLYEYIGLFVEGITPYENKSTQILTREETDYAENKGVNNFVSRANLLEQVFNSINEETQTPFAKYIIEKTKKSCYYQSFKCANNQIKQENEDLKGYLEVYFNDEYKKQLLDLTETKKLNTNLYNYDDSYIIDTKDMGLTEFAQYAQDTAHKIYEKQQEKTDGTKIINRIKNQRFIKAKEWNKEPH